MSERINPDELTLKDKVVAINRVAKVVKGGKRFSFGAVVVIGDGQGHVGIGKGKAAEVPEAIRKAVEHARKDLIHIPLRNGTIPFEVTGHFGAEDVLFKPAAPGTGIIAGGPVRALLEVAGVQNVLSKSLGSGNAFNVIKATMEALRSIKRAEQVRKIRKPEAPPTAEAGPGGSGPGVEAA